MFFYDLEGPFNAIPPGYFQDTHLIVGGLTRGGTQYTANFLRKLGVSCGHEGIFGARGLRPPPFVWRTRPITAEVSGLVAPFVSTLPEHLDVVHLIRHPVRCIQSNLAFFRKLEGKWDEMCQLYLRWHQQIEKRALFTIHLERFGSECGGLVQLARPNPTPSQLAIDAALQAADRGARQYTPDAKGWDALPAELQDYARSHGYGP